MGIIVPVIMGSKSDDGTEHNKKLYAALEKHSLPYHRRVASAHKYPGHLLKVLEEYDSQTGLFVVYITVAGRSDGLSATTSANTVNPVIACPPPSDKYGGMVNLSTFYVPSRTCPMYVMDPENAALAAARIFAMTDPELQASLREDIVTMKQSIEDDDEDMTPSVL
jgi:phosphoribosylaminoimidazole carboxylase PurE protein